MHPTLIPTGCPITDAGVNLRHGRGDTAGVVCHTWFYTHAYDVSPHWGSIPAHPFPTRVYTRAYGMPPLPGLGAVRYVWGDAHGLYLLQSFRLVVLEKFFSIWIKFSRTNHPSSQSLSHLRKG